VSIFEGVFLNRTSPEKGFAKIWQRHSQLRFSELIQSGFFEESATLAAPLFWQLRQLEPCRLSTFRGNGEIARHSVFPDLEGTRLAGLARGQHPDLRRRGIEF
jgi:hypothetical protein